MVLAPILPGREGNLRDLLSTMTKFPGHADPDNALVPFGAFETVHFARFVILDNSTLSDLEPFGATFPDAPVYLAFLGDCDGRSDDALRLFAAKADAGLRRIFAHCDGFDSGADLFSWMLSRSVKSATFYVHWIGRTVQQIREEAELHKALIHYHSALSPDDSPQHIHRLLAVAVKENGPALTPPAPTPLWWWAHCVRLFGSAGLAAVVFLSPLLLLPFWVAVLIYAALALALAAFVFQLRQAETIEPEVLTPPTDEHLTALGKLQDYDVTNQYSAFGVLKPGKVWRILVRVIFPVLKVATPLLYPRGRLARIRTIHFARWVSVDDGRRMFFASNYDGGSEAYMDDFVNKVAFGLNLTFSNGCGFPRTKFLLSGGAKKEQQFKDTQRRHALPTEVWYKAYPGLTLFDINRNARLRDGLERTAMTDAEIRQWLAEI